MNTFLTGKETMDKLDKSIETKNYELIQEDLNLEVLEQTLLLDLEEQMQDLHNLEIDRELIDTPDTLGEIVLDTIWEQFINQIGIIAGEDFIKENRGLTLDLRDSAHTQTTDNFAKGKIATHNNKIDYQKRYNDWKANFQHDENGNVTTHQTRTGKEEATLARDARKPFDQGRPAGSAERGTDIDHTISAGQIIRDPVANAHMSKDEQIAFANSKANLNEMDAGQNRSKGDMAMTDWLDNPNKNGQKPSEIFDISEEQDKQYREKDTEARAEYEKLKKKGEQRSVDTGKQSKKEEAILIGKKALRSVVMGLLVSLLKDIIRKLIVWFKSGKKALTTFLDSVKEAIVEFISNIKEHLLNAGNTLVTTIATAILGPVIGMIKKAWIFLKQGFRSIKDVASYLQKTANKNVPLSVRMFEVGKILVVSLTASGTIVLGEVIEKGLMTTPIALEIPLIGNLASFLGIFFGALVSGLIGAIALFLINKAIAKKYKTINKKEYGSKQNDLLITQGKIISVTEQCTEDIKINCFNTILQRHHNVAVKVDRSVETIVNNGKRQEVIKQINRNKLDSLFDELDNF